METIPVTNKTQLGSKKSSSTLTQSNFQTPSTPELLEDIGALFSHDIEKSASAVRMFFEIFKKETPGPRDLQRWSQNTERSFSETRKWLKLLTPLAADDASAPTHHKDLREDLNTLVQDLDLRVKGKPIESLPEHAASQALSDCLVLFKEFARRSYDTSAAYVTFQHTAEFTRVTLSHLALRASALQGAKLALYLLQLRLGSIGADLERQGNKELSLKLPKI